MLHFKTSFYGGKFYWELTVYITCELYRFQIKFSSKIFLDVSECNPAMMLCLPQPFKNNLRGRWDRSTDWRLISIARMSFFTRNRETSSIAISCRRKGHWVYAVTALKTRALRYFIWRICLTIRAITRSHCALRSDSRAHVNFYTFCRIICVSR